MIINQTKVNPFQIKLIPSPPEGWGVVLIHLWTMDTGHWPTQLHHENCKGHHHNLFCHDEVITNFTRMPQLVSILNWLRYITSIVFFLSNIKSLRESFETNQIFLKSSPSPPLSLLDLDKIQFPYCRPPSLLLKRKCQRSTEVGNRLRLFVSLEICSQLILWDNSSSSKKYLSKKAR